MSMDMKGGMFTSMSGEWATPKELFTLLDLEFHFDVDLCATEDNALCDEFCTVECSLLGHIPHGQRAYMNPPYGRKIGSFIERAVSLFDDNYLDVLVMLLPSRTDTKWWHEYCMRGETRFIKGRLKFGGSQNSAPFPSAVVIYE